MSIGSLHQYKMLVFVSPYKHLQSFVCFQYGTSTQAFNPHFYITV
jgi:hypothetical protein